MLVVFNETSFTHCTEWSKKWQNIYKMTTEIDVSYVLHWKNVDFNSLRKQYGFLKIELFSDLGRTVNIVALKLNECRQPSHKIHHSDLFLLKIRKNALGDRHSATKDIKNVWVE